MQPNTGMHKLRFASCSVLLLLLTLALVASSLLVARYAVQASSWWLSLLAVTVCLLGLCTWIQLAASRAGRWRVLLARQIALSRAQASARTLHRPGLGPGLAPDFYNSYGGSRSSSTGMGIAHIAVIPLECELDSHMGYRVPGPPPPPPYALTDLPPSYCVSTTDESRPTDGAGGASPPAPAPPPPPGPTGLEQPPPYAVAIKRDHLVQEAAGATPPSPAVTAAEGDSTAGAGDNRRSTPVSRRPVLWF